MLRREVQKFSTDLSGGEQLTVLEKKYREMMKNPDKSDASAQGDLFLCRRDGPY
jgi:hypothetical protein